MSSKLSASFRAARTGCAASGRSRGWAAPSRSTSWWTLSRSKARQRPDLYPITFLESPAARRAFAFLETRYGCLFLFHGGSAHHSAERDDAARTIDPIRHLQPPFGWPTPLFLSRTGHQRNSGQTSSRSPP